MLNKKKTKKQKNVRDRVRGMDSQQHQQAAQTRDEPQVKQGRLKWLQVMLCALSSLALPAFSGEGGPNCSQSCFVWLSLLQVPHPHTYTITMVVVMSRVQTGYLALKRYTVVNHSVYARQGQGNTKVDVLRSRVIYYYGYPKSLVDARQHGITERGTFYCGTMGPRNSKREHLDSTNDK